MPKTINGMIVVEVGEMFLLVTSPTCPVCKGTGAGIGTAKAIEIWSLNKNPMILAEGFDVEKDCSDIKKCPCRRPVRKPEDWDLREMIDAAKEDGSMDSTSGADDDSGRSGR